MRNSSFCGGRRNYLINNNNVNIHLTLINLSLYFQFNLYHTDSFFKREILQSTIDSWCFEMINNDDNYVRDHVFFKILRIYDHIKLVIKWIVIEFIAWSIIIAKSYLLYDAIDIFASSIFQSNINIVYK